MTKIDRAVAALREAAAALQDLPPDIDVLRSGGILEHTLFPSPTAHTLEKEADRLQEIQIGARAALEVPGS